MSQYHRRNNDGYQNNPKRFKSSYDDNSATHSSSECLNISWNRQSFDKNFPNFQKPKILGSFSVDGKRSYRSDRSQLKFFDPKRFRNSGTGQYEKVELDLNAGKTKAVLKIPECKDEQIDHMLRWILANKDTLKDPSRPEFDRLPADFVCFRGLLVALMSSLYDNNNDWEVWAIKLRGTIYLCAKETLAKQQRESGMTERERTMSSWGYKFEQYMQTDLPTSRKADLKSDPDESRHVGVNENEEFCCMFRSRLGDSSIIYGAEMDGFQLTRSDDVRKSIDEIDLSSDGHFVEMKTSRLIENERQQNTFYRYKTQKWWAQSFMVGIPTIICGFRDDDGFACKLEDFPVGSLPKLAQNPFWLPNVCMNFLDELLRSIKARVKQDLRVYKFILPLRSQTILVREDPDERGFLPDWFLKKVFEK